MRAEFYGSMAAGAYRIVSSLSFLSYHSDARESVERVDGPIAKSRPLRALGIVGEVNVSASEAKR